MKQLRLAITALVMIFAVAIIGCNKDQSLTTQPPPGGAATVGGIATSTDMAARFSDATWSTPVNVGAPINSAFTE